MTKADRKQKGKREKERGRRETVTWTDVTQSWGRPITYEDWISSKEPWIACASIASEDTQRTADAKDVVVQSEQGHP